MNRTFLNFEQPIEELDQKIKALRVIEENNKEINLVTEIKYLENKKNELICKIFSKLEPWQISQISRHPLRPQTIDYINNIFTDFQELHGDRHYSSAPAIIGGLARLNKDPVLVLGNQKGRKTKEKIYRNFGMARPEEYRKALRLMKLAEKFCFPIFTFIDTAGAYPGIEAEERNQSEAIARNLLEMSTLKTYIICTIIGEAGSGGALAIGIGDIMLMLQYSTYSVISPEGCASILWKDVSKYKDAAKSMKITAEQILELNLIDRIIPEPLGGAHRCMHEITMNVKKILMEEIDKLKQCSLENLLQKRYKKIMNMGI